MEKQVVFREYQEQTAADHNNIQTHVRTSIDHLTNDAVTKSNRYAGFAVVKTAQAEVNIAPGRMYNQVGAIFSRASNLTQSMVPHLAAAAKRIVAVSVYGNETETDTQERDFLVNTETGQTQPDAVPMARSRDAVVAFTAGAESADPQSPPIPASHALIAYILVDNLQIVSITMMTDNAVISTENLHIRTKDLEAFRAAIEPRVTAIATDVAALANDVDTRGDNYALSMLYRDIARVKAALEIPDLASDYGADRFLTPAKSDIGNALALGFNAKVEEGIRFAPEAENVSAMNLFSANDPNASVNSGLLLPAYDSILKMEIGPYHSDTGIAQYGFQTHELIQRSVARARIRYGAEFTVCTNSQWWKDGTYDPTTGILKRNGEVFEDLGQAPGFYETKWRRVRQVFTDWYDEAYWDYITVSHTITGAQVAQSFLVGNDMWATRLGFYLTVKAANENVFLSLCEITNGVPDLSKVILHQTVPHADLLSNDWTVVNIVPTFLKAGKRYAVVLTSNANHRVGMASGQSYLDGTFFYTTDSVYYQGDLMKDLMVQVWGAKFRAPQVTIEFNALSLSGGIQSIDILSGAVEPYSTELIYELQPGGSGAWRALTVEDLEALSGSPPLCRFRARFVGTRDMMPGLMLTGSEVKISRPKTAFKHISTMQELATASDNITVQILLENFDPTPHTIGCRLRVGATWETADTVETKLMSAADGRYLKTFNFLLPAAASTFAIEVTGSTTASTSMFHVAERVHFALPA